MARPETGRFPSPNAQNAPARIRASQPHTTDVSEEMLDQAQAAWDRMRSHRQDQRMMAAISAAGLADYAAAADLRLYDVMRTYRAGRQRLGHSDRLRRALAYVIAESGTQES